MSSDHCGIVAMKSWSGRHCLMRLPSRTYSGSQVRMAPLRFELDTSQWRAPCRAIERVVLQFRCGPDDGLLGLPRLDYLSAYHVRPQAAKTAFFVQALSFSTGIVTAHCEQAAGAFIFVFCAFCWYLFAPMILPTVDFPSRCRQAT